MLDLKTTAVRTGQTRVQRGYVGTSDYYPMLASEHSNTGKLCIYYRR